MLTSSVKIGNNFVNVVKGNALGPGDLKIGGRVQRLRRQKTMSQSELAAVLGISPSYLNMIEHNRRRITVPLLLKLCGYFGIEAGELAESDESRLVGDLMEIFGDNVFAESNLTNHDIRDLASSNPAVGRAMIALFDRYRALSRTSTPTVEVGYHVATDAISDFIQENANYFSTLETEAERVRNDVDQVSDTFDHGLKGYLLNAHGLRWRLAALPAGLVLRLDAARREIVTADVLPIESSLFALAHHVGRVEAGPAIDRLIAGGALAADAHALARNALAAYFAAALVMPYQPFLRACRETRYDIDRIARRFNASFEQVCHRMTTLQRPAHSGIPLHLIRTDIAGNISKRFSLSGIHIPRHSGACPRWNVYGAFLHPEQINIQISQMPEGQRYFCVAKSIAKGGHRHNQDLRTENLYMRS